MIVYVCIGNSDDKLTQAEWSEYIRLIDQILGVGASTSRWWWMRDDKPIIQIHGRWFAAPDVPWQSACWCVEFDYDLQIVAVEDGQDRRLGDDLHRRLADAARRYRQNSIAWAQVPITEYIHPPPASTVKKEDDPT